MEPLVMDTPDCNKSFLIFRARGVFLSAKAVDFRLPDVVLQGLSYEGGLRKGSQAERQGLEPCQIVAIDFLSRIRSSLV
jgi:hypothetical protein